MSLQRISTSSESEIFTFQRGIQNSRSYSDHVHCELIERATVKYFVFLFKYSINFLKIKTFNIPHLSLKTGFLIIEGKTKRVLEIVGDSENVLMVSKDRITAGDGVKAHDVQGKSVISTETTARIFEYLNKVGIQTHYVKQHDEKSLIVNKCDMIPIEWVSRRHATGSFLKRHSGVKEEYRFSSLKLETFFKDDENHDPQWTDGQLICAELVVGGVKIGRTEVEIMHKTTACIFEVLEKAWAAV